MKDSLLQKLQSLCERHEEISVLLSDSEIIADQQRFRELSREYAELEDVVTCFRRFQQLREDSEEARILLEDSDAELREFAAAELADGQEEMQRVQLQLHNLLLPRDPSDASNVFLEIRAGTGGDEAALFCGDLWRMYSRYAEAVGWRLEIINERPGEHGGYKEIISRVEGRDVYAQLKFESGAHRVQRVPETESQGRIHTSACTVAILPEVDEIDDITINKADLRVDTYRASGAGGQHVNKTDSAVRITYLPTGLVAECQDERSQHRNRERAMSLLRAKLVAEIRGRQIAEQSQQRRNLVGSGDRSGRIRTYNYPQGRITDHRINLTLYRLSEVLEGELGALLEPLRQEYQAEQLALLSEQL